MPGLKPAMTKRVYSGFQTSPAIFAPSSTFVSRMTTAAARLTINTSGASYELLKLIVIVSSAETTSTASEICRARQL